MGVASLLPILPLYCLEALTRREKYYAYTVTVYLAVKVLSYDRNMALLYDETGSL